MQQELIVNFTLLNNNIERIMQTHSQHDYNSDCEICIREQNASLMQWWHSTAAIEHRNRGCVCINCEQTKLFKWRSFKDKGRCSCPLCK